jgi:cob(I)alamin adenosyltransferase
MSIATKGGDGGTTHLLYGRTVSKADLRIEACGAVDELNSFLGLARSFCPDDDICRQLEQLQRESFVLGGELATPPDKRPHLKKRVSAEMLAALDAVVAQKELLPGLLSDWALPGGTQAGAALDVARSVARRAERCIVRLHESEALENPHLLPYVNRLSDVLWLLGRSYEMSRGVDGALRPERKII